MITAAAVVMMGAAAGAITLIVALSRRREWNAEGEDDRRRARLAQPDAADDRDRGADEGADPYGADEGDDADEGRS